MSASDEAVLTQVLWAEFRDRLRGFIARRIANEADADDILQEVFLRIHLHRDSVRHSDRLGAWLFQVTRNAIADYYRAPNRRLEIPVGASLEPFSERPEQATDSYEGAAAAGQAAQELATCLRPMVERLPAHYREAVTLTDLEGFTQRAAAERIGISVSGMKSRVQRGRQALKTMLDGCCQIELDADRRVIDFEARDASCAACSESCR